MSDGTKIEWTEATWNTVYGCDKVSPACAHCYIERTPPYRMQGLKFERGRIPVRLMPERLTAPLRWTRPRMIFVNSLGDTFHEDVPDEFIAEVFDVMARARQHTFQILTKRPERMRRWVQAIAATPVGQPKLPGGYGWLQSETWPLPNAWLGVTAENQRWADERIPLLLDTPAAVRFVSCEPLLSGIDLRLAWGHCREHDGHGRWCSRDCTSVQRLNWVICGGESAGPARRRLVDGPFDVIGHPKYLPTVQGHGWVSSLRDQCDAAGVPFFFKQWGGPTPKSGGRGLDGRTWDEMPGGSSQEPVASSKGADA